MHIDCKNPLNSEYEKKKKQLVDNLKQINVLMTTFIQSQFLKLTYQLILKPFFYIPIFSFVL
jgi:hypothetical protein